MSNSEEKPAWLVFLDQAEHDQDLDFVGQETVVFVRDLLSAPDGEENAIATTIQAMRAYYRENYGQPDDPLLKRDTTFGTRQVIGNVVSHVFDVAPHVPYNDPRHRRLADLIIELKGQALKEFDPEDPQLGWDDTTLNVDAREASDTYHLNPTSSADRCGAALNVHTLLARLTGAGMLEDGVIWATEDISEGLEQSGSSDQPPLIQNALAAIATQYILFAAEVLAKHVAEDKWKLWASKLQHLAETSTDSTEWNLKQHAQKAFKKLVEVRPELFEE